uniref:Uncharacterized protein n=1 Tax=Avena sativa TaxID=4498 RepID=A0ACD5WI37_AVESA
MVEVGSRVRGFLRNRWLVFVAAMWMQSVAGVGYLFGSISPVIKASLGYNQRQVASLGVAKDLGGNVGFLAGTLCAVLPLWAALLVGAAQNLVGYGWVWLAVTHRVPVPPLWAMCILFTIGNNGLTYFNTAALVSCVENFPNNRGPVVGILKGFAGLSGAILTQIYAIVHSPDDAALIFMVAVGPAMVVISVMFIVRPVGGHTQARPSDGISFTFVHSLCLVLAAYLMGVMLLEDLVGLSQTLTIVCTIVLMVLLLVPVVIPVILSFFSNDDEGVYAALLPSSRRGEASGSVPYEEQHEVLVSEVQDEGRKGPWRGEDCTLLQAIIKADFWLLFFSLLLGSGSGLTVFDNLG